MYNERRFADSIGQVAVQHCPAGHYQVPYRCLVPEELDGLLVAGRCISADDWVIGSARLIPPAMVTGQAAGVAAALALRADVPPRNLDSGVLREHLGADGVIL